MDMKFVVVWCVCAVICVKCEPSDILKTLLNSPCNYPPLSVTDDNYKLDWKYCDLSETIPTNLNETLIRTICERIEQLEEDDCKLLTSISFSIEDVIDRMTDDVQQMCKSNGLKDYFGCVETCKAALAVCDVYVATEDLMRERFSEAVRGNFSLMENFIHSGKLTYVIPFPPRGSLHSMKQLGNCSSAEMSPETESLCKAVVEVAVNISQVGAHIKFDPYKLEHNVTSAWEPCDGLPGLLKNATCECVKPLKSENTCKDTCTKGGTSICKMIYLGLESLQAAGQPGQQTAERVGLLTTPKPADPSGNDNPDQDQDEADRKTLAPEVQAQNNLTAGPQTNTSVTPKPNGNTPASTTVHNHTQVEKVTNGTVNNTAIPTKEKDKPAEAPQPGTDNPTKEIQKTTTAAATTTTATTTAKKTTESATVMTTSDDTSEEEGNNKDTDYNPKEGEENKESESKQKTNLDTQKPPRTEENAGDEAEESGGHFMAYFLVFIVLCVAGYIVFHNKQKIIALVIEGKNAHSSRRPSTKDYKKLKTEDVMPSLEKSAYTKNYVF